MRIEKISAVTFQVRNMKASAQFYRDALGMELFYGGEGSGFSSLCARDSDSAILNLEEGDGRTEWGRLIFHVPDVDACWKHLTDLGFPADNAKCVLGRAVFSHVRSGWA
jgi:catechol 2,3-dioxygenase-like lactoylglutathione lyase family enzyme